MSLSAVITGHTRGIGEATLNLLKSKEIEVSGIARSNGYDLENQYDKIKKYILKNDFDIFINNAYVTNNQTKLLKDIYTEWQDKNKIIINICSVAALLPYNHPDYELQYPRDKRSQREFCQKINFEYSKKNFVRTKCGLINLNFDYVKTSFKSKYDKKLFPNLLPTEVANVIWYTIESFRNNICFRDISFHSTDAPDASQLI